MSLPEEITFKAIAHIENDFGEKFGIPRQSGLSDIVSRIVFEPPYHSPEAFAGIEGYSHLWLIWLFSETAGRGGALTVRPPKLGGNKRVGVFASRSPFRPNPVGLSSVRLIKAEYSSSNGTVLYVSGADLMNGTPIIDIKPYLAYTDSHPEALRGFSPDEREGLLQVEFPPKLLEIIPAGKRDVLISVLANDPRPAYQHSGERVYTMSFGGFQISFKAEGKTLSVVNVTK